MGQQLRILPGTLPLVERVTTIRFGQTEAVFDSGPGIYVSCARPSPDAANLRKVQRARRLWPLVVAFVCARWGKAPEPRKRRAF